MPSVLEQKFKITFTVPKKHEQAVQKYLEENISHSQINFTDEITPDIDLIHPIDLEENDLQEGAE